MEPPLRKTQPPVTSRKSHRKSRVGCANCKLRKIKCDETKPSCVNCVQHAIRCDYDDRPSSKFDASTPRSPRSDRVSTTRISETNPIKRPRGRPRKLFAPPIDSDPLSATGSRKRQGGVLSKNVSITTAHLDIEKLRLMHQYSTSTGSTLAGSPGTAKVDRFWRVVVPKLAFSHPFLVHAILSVAAVHLARLSPDHHVVYLTTAESHFAQSVEQMGLELVRLNADNCEPLWVASILVCYHMLGKGPQPGNYLCFGGEDSTKWISLLRGCRAIMDNMHEHIGRGPLAELFVSDPEDGGVAKILSDRASRRQSLDYTTAFASVRQLVEQSKSDSPNTLDDLEALDILRRSYDAVYGDEEDRLKDNNGIVFVWLWRVSDNFVHSLLGEQPISLIIFAYFTVLLSTLEDHWFVKGWPIHILDGIDASVSPEYRSWLQWPRDVMAGKI